MIKKRLIISKDAKAKTILAEPALTHGDRLNKLCKLLILYPDEAKVIDKDTGLSRVKWLHDKCGNTVAMGLAQFADYLDTGGILDGRSWYLMVDMYKIASYLYEKESTTIIRDDSFDRLSKFLADNIKQLLDRQIIPRLINREAISNHTGMAAAYSLTSNDISLAKHVLTMVGVIQNGNKAQSGSKTGRDVRGSTADTKVNVTNNARTYKLIKRVAKK